MESGLFRMLPATKAVWKSAWPYAFLFLILLLIIPVIGIFSQFNVTILEKALTLVLKESTWNSVFLVLVTSILTIAIGSMAAWLVTFYTFPFRKWIDWLLIIPITIPPYAMAYIFKGVFAPFGTLDGWFGIHLDVTNLPVLSLLMSLVLFPYVYTPLRASLRLQSSSLMEVAKLSGVSGLFPMMRSILPMHRPAIIGGVLLVALETLNEYGAPAYFGIKTYTTEIIRLWDPRDLTGSVAHALLALLLVGIILAAESRFNRKTSQDNFLKKAEGDEHAKRSLGAFAFCSVLLTFSFVLPVAQLLSWVTNNWKLLIDPEMLGALIYTMFLATSTGVILLITSIFLAYFIFQFQHQGIAKLLFFAKLGYAIPGAIIGIGVLIPIGWLSDSTSILLTGTAGLLIAAYGMRYQSVALNGIDSTFQKISHTQLDASRMLGKSRLGSLFTIFLPQTRRALLGSALLIIVDISKELPLTMLFQRFNQETLAVKAFIMMDTEGAFYKASVPSLWIILLGLISIFIFRFLDRNS